VTTDNLCFYLQLDYQTSQTGGQRYSDTSPFSIPCLNLWLLILLRLKLTYYPVNPAAVFLEFSIFPFHFLQLFWGRRDLTAPTRSQSTPTLLSPLPTLSRLTSRLSRPRRFRRWAMTSATTSVIWRKVLAEISVFCFVIVF
jgi:hypothetical protein